MTARERVLHAVLFELFAIIFTVILTSLFTSHSTGALTGVIILISVIAMVWNFIFNWGFDKVITGERVARGLGIRIIHSLLFEGGLLIFTIPLVMYMLNIGWWEAFLLDIGMTLFILVYSVIFNWVYDHLRLKFIKSS
ncbi:PACE efflux transporter [Mannheimia sp. AT1]|uniref:PACE efflux transporter n=1 Tax=Mannheimia cairinae TaxID=3025936 RepID=A0ABT5MQM8_9PAST|nr:PACE efflux transporter [Mannheimia cairinae]MDD0824297.1 PACE efflux transporter [Mannheimia cairinae]MDD0826580.1 PACE efflux transporter [Mannheimia cairinae]